VWSRPRHTGDWGLRDYKLEPVVWGGSAGCPHQWSQWNEWHEVREEVQTGKTRTTDRYYGEPSRRFNGSHHRHTAGQSCAKCGAWRGQLGLEPAPEMYVQHLVEVFREVRRVLRQDGTLWLVLGDSYTSGGRKTRDPGQSRLHPAFNGWASGRPETPSGLKPKDLVGIPWRVAFALQADGWYLRSDIIWAKPNPVPSSVRDRPTRAHEIVFLLSRSRRYYYDADAIAEPCVTNPCENYPARARVTGRGTQGSAAARGNDRDKSGGFPPRISGQRKELHGPTYSRHRSSIEGGQSLQAEPSAWRNKRSVWTIATRPFPEAHFAVFPPQLAETCILAGCPEGGIVLDPFMGAGTVMLVSEQLGRHSIGVDLSPEYCRMAEARVRKWLEKRRK